MARQLDAAITDSATQIKVSPTFDRADFPENGVIQIETELIRYENTTGDEFLQCTRGYLGTTPAAHEQGTSVVLYSEVPENPETISSASLLSPAAIDADIVDGADILTISSVMADTLVLTLPSPSDPTPIRFLTVCHTTASAGTLSVDGVDIAPASHALFVWDGSAWTTTASSGGGSGSLQLDDNQRLYFNTAQTVSLRFDTVYGGLVYDDGGSGLVFKVPYNEIYMATDDDGAGAASLDLNSAGAGCSINAPATRTVKLKIDGTPSLQVDDSAVAGETRLLVWDVDNSTLERVTVGAADSGGTGFKLLRIPN